MPPVSAAFCDTDYNAFLNISILMENISIDLKCPVGPLGVCTIGNISLDVFLLRIRPYEWTLTRPSVHRLLAGLPYENRYEKVIQYDNSMMRSLGQVSM